MQLLRRLSALFGLICACLLSSCLDGYDEDMVIYSDLSGAATVRVKLPDSLISKFDAVREEFSVANIQKRFAKLSGVTLKSYDLGEGRYPEAVFQIAFSSIEKLNAAIAANKPAQIIAGEFKVTKDNDGRSVITREFGNGKPTMELPSDKFALFKTHFQTPVELSNTDSGFKDSSHSDVRYRWALSDLVLQKPSMVNKLIKPLPWLLIFIGALVLLLVAWFGWLTFGQKKVVRKPVAPPLEKASEPETPPPQASQPPQRPGTPQRPGPPRRPGPPQR